MRERYNNDTVDEYWELTKSCVIGMLLLASVAVLAAVLQPKTDGSDTPAWVLIIGLFTFVLLRFMRATRQYGRFRRLAARDWRAGSGGAQAQP